MVVYNLDNVSAHQDQVLDEVAQEPMACWRGVGKGYWTAGAGKASEGAWACYSVSWNDHSWLVSAITPVSRTPPDLQACISSVSSAQSPLDVYQHCVLDA